MLPKTIWSNWFGTVSSSASNSITFDASDWPADTPDFTDHFILLSEGNQIAQITNDTGGNGSTRTFTIDYNLNSWGTSTWGTLPPAGTTFEVDGGKWCRITLSWDRPFNQDPRTAEREVFVPWRAAGT